MTIDARMNARKGHSRWQCISDGEFAGGQDFEMAVAMSWESRAGSDRDGLTKSIRIRGCRE
jgi:hypothetical protein